MARIHGTDEARGHGDTGRARSEVADGAIDTVLLVMTDMQGRLMGKRLHAPFFVDGASPSTARRAATTCSPSTST